MIRNLQYRLFCKLWYETLLGASQDMI